MNVCSDTSFIVKLLTSEPGTEAAVNIYRKLNRPKLPYTWVHRLEVESALARKMFTSAQSNKSKQVIKRKYLTSQGRLQKWLQLSFLLEIDIPWERCFENTLKFLPHYSETIGCRTFDMIHLSIAKELNAEIFLTCDRNQAKAAKAEGFQTELVVY